MQLAQNFSVESIRNEIAEPMVPLFSDGVVLLLLFAGIIVVGLVIFIAWKYFVVGRSLRNPGTASVPRVTTILQPNVRIILGHIIIAIFSFLAAFFGVFNVLFSDVNDVGEEASAVTLIVVVYAVLSLLAHLVWPIRGWMWVRWLVTPALLIGGFYLFQEFNSLSLYGVLILMAVVAGATLGREVMSRKREKQSPPTPKHQAPT